MISNSNNIKKNCPPLTLTHIPIVEYFLFMFLRLKVEWYTRIYTCE
jgi:hypothetical protein